MKCVNCSHEQASGKFCGKCGTPLQVIETAVIEEVPVSQPANETVATVESASVAHSTPNPAPVAQTIAQPSQPAQPNEQVERVKETSKKYIEYVKEFAVKPSRIFTNPENQFTNALITLAILLLLASFTVFSAIKSVYSSTVAGFGSDLIDIFETRTPKLPFFSIFSNAFLSFLVLIAISVVITLVVLKISKQPINFRSLVGIYGTLVIPIIGVVVLSLLLVLINELALGLWLLFLGFSLAVYLYPLRIVFHNFSGELKIDVIHRGLMYFGGFSIVIYVVATQYIQSKVGSFTDLLDSLYYFF
jgi:hypothetical protein